MIVAVIALLVLAGMSLGLRTTALFLDARVRPELRLAAALVVGGLGTAVVLQVCSSYHVFELGLGLLLSLSPVGLFDLAKWWFRSRRLK